MRVTRVLLLLNSQTIEALRTSIRKSISEAPAIINTVKDEQKKILYDKIVNLNKWYTRIIGLDEVKVYQDRVTSLQDQLSMTQEKRREVGRQLADIRQKSMQLQSEIHKVNRQDEFDKFLELMKQETEILKLEKSISTTFQDYDRTERELFTAFANAIRDSHEKQRAQLEYTKYFGLVLSIAGSFLAFVYTTVRKHDLKLFMQEKLSSIEDSTKPVLLNLIDLNETTQKEVANNTDKIDQVMKSLSIIPRMLVRNEQNSVAPTGNSAEDSYQISYVKIVGGTVIGYILLRSLFG